MPPKKTEKPAVIQIPRSGKKPRVTADMEVAAANTAPIDSPVALMDDRFLVYTDDVVVDGGGFLYPRNLLSRNSTVQYILIINSRFSDGRSMVLSRVDSRYRTAPVCLPR